MFDYLAELSEILKKLSVRLNLENLKSQLTWVWILVLGARLCQKPYNLTSSDCKIFKEYEVIAKHLK